MAGHGDVSPPTHSRPGGSEAERERVQRVRKKILDALIDVVVERGFQGASVSLVVARAKVSNRTFYEQFSGLRDCFEAVLDLGLTLPAELIVRAFAREQNWRDGVRAALAELLEYFDSEPGLTRIWFSEALTAGAWALEHRERNIAGVQALIVEHWYPDGSSRADPVLVRGVMSSTLAALTTHVITRRPEAMVTLLAPLTSLIVTPFLDADAIKVEVERAEALAQKLRDARRSPADATPGANAAPNAEPGAELGARPDVGPGAGSGVRIPDTLLLGRAHRARRCLRYLAAQNGREPGPSNHEIGEGIGIAHPGQTSKLLARLADQGLLAKRPGAPGEANAWTLTPEGRRVTRALEEYW